METNEWHLLYNENIKIKDVVPKNQEVVYESSWYKFGKLALDKAGNDELLRNEIIRECSKLGYIIIGGKEKLWRRFLKDYLPNNCLSYCDFGKFNGHSYLKLGFKKERLNKPGFVWYDINSKQIYQRTPWKHNEYKDFLKLYDCGQLVFSWRSNN